MADLVLTIPFGLAPEIFPWGAEVLRKYLNHNKPEVDVCIWDLRNEEQISELLAKHQDCISQTINLLFKVRRNLGQLDTTGHSPLRIRAYYTAVILKFGSDLFSILRREKIPFDVNMRKKYEEQLKELKQNFESIVQKKAREHLGGRRRFVFGLSIYDFTLFESLHLASIIRRVQDGVSIIIGGDAVDIPAARAIVERNKDIDGAVIGFGELILSDVMQSFLNGSKIRDMQFDGLMNAKTTSRSLSIPDIEEIAVQHASIIRHQIPSYVRFDSKKRAINILARRGCGWGRCTFCRITVKKTFIDADLASTKLDIKKVLDELSLLESVSDPVHVKFSAENNEIEFVIDLLIWLSNQAQTRKMKFNVWFWMTVQQFSRDIVHKLQYLRRNKDINLDVSVAIESLNPVSLRNMKKGITPLQGLKALKTLHDLGGKNSCNYFMFFPLDTLDGVSKEYHFMKNSLHLISAPLTRLEFINYAANNRDAISRNPQKYGIVLNPYDDIWMNKAFNIDMPMCSFAVDYSLVPSKTAEGKIINSWYRIVRKKSWITWTKIKYKATLKLLWWLISALPDIPRHIIAQAVIADFSYLKRNWIILNLVWWKRWSLGNHSGNSRYPQFFLKDSRLIKKYPWPIREKWSIELNPLELEVLRYLYGPRQYDDVVAEFKTKYSEKSISEILDKHLSLGSILRHKNMLMSIFHDPGFLQAIEN